LARLATATESDPLTLVKFVRHSEIDMDHEPEGFVLLKQGRRVMVLKHVRGGCMYLDKENRCTVYEHRPLGCRVFPLDPTFSKSGKLVRLTLIEASECPYELDGKQSINEMQSLNSRYDAATELYHAKIASWNRLQRRRKRQGHRLQGARQFLNFLGAVPFAKLARAFH
jgi:Fe-S-cluster containining protein